MQKIDLVGESMVAITRRLRAVELEPNLWAYELTKRVKRAGDSGDLQAGMNQLAVGGSECGFVDDKNLQLIKEGQSHKRKELMVLNKVAQDLLRTHGWKAWESIQDKNAGADVKQAMDGKLDLDTIVRQSWSSHMLFDRHGKPLPVGIEFDYIAHGGISEGRYDLKKLAEHLLTRDDIWVYPIDRVMRDRPNLDARATKAEECICDIPYYNSEKWSSKTIHFRWMPSREDYARMWDWCLSHDKKYPSTKMHEAIFALDLIGARAAGTTYYDSYHESRRYDDKYRND